jgi:radical SAM superfamily enzyme YgiQ (UPF0313 family)
LTETICLITAAVSTDFEDPEEAQSRQVRAVARAPKLGVLTLAGVLEQAGLRPRIFDMDEAYADYLAEGGHRGLAGFPAWVAPRILSSDARIFGFSSLCSSYPLSIRVAEHVKCEAPRCTVLFGGPQASAVDLLTLSVFPFVDFILRGEAEISLPVFLDRWSGERRFSDVPGLTWRSPLGPRRNPDAPVIDNLDDLPLPAYDLGGSLKDVDYAFLELGRGCPFSCAFCSTNDFFRRRFRVKSPKRMLADMRSMASRFGFRSFNLVHDMFTADRRKVVAFCDAMIESDEGFNWSCSARTDCVDEELLDLMARAGCNSIFFGVETGSKRMQRIIDKDLDPAQARTAVETAERLGMLTTVSTIAGFPEENEDDLRETLDIFMHSLRHPHSIPQLNLLAPLAGTRIYSQYKDRMVLEDVCSHLSYTGRSLSCADRELVRNYPAIFSSFYLLPTPGLDRSSLMELGEFLPMGRKMLRWLLVALYQRRADILDFFRAWRQRRLALHPDMDGGSLRHYYTLDTSRNELVGFLRGRMAEFGDAAVEALVAYEETLAQAVARAPARPEGPPASGRIASAGIPVRAPDLHVVELDYDIQSVIDALKRAAPPAVSRTRKYYRTAESSPGESHLIEITPLVARSLQLCDGAHTVEEFTVLAGPLFDCPEELRRYAARCLLKCLRDEGLIEIYRSSRGRRRAAGLYRVKP